MVPPLMAAIQYMYTVLQPFTPTSKIKTINVRTIRRYTINFNGLRDDISRRPSFHHAQQFGPNVGTLKCSMRELAT